MRRILLVVLSLLLLVTTVSAQDDPTAPYTVPLGHCLDNLDLSEVSVWSVTNGKTFEHRPLWEGEYEAISAIPATTVWRGYDAATVWGWHGSDFPGPPMFGRTVYQWDNIRGANGYGRLVLFQSHWDSRNIYLLPILRPGEDGEEHGGIAPECSLYVTPRQNVIDALQGYRYAEPDWLPSFRCTPEVQYTYEPLPRCVSFP